MSVIPVLTNHNIYIHSYINPNTYSQTHTYSLPERETSGIREDKMTNKWGFWRDRFVSPCSSLDGISRMAFRWQVKHSTAPVYEQSRDVFMVIVLSQAIPGHKPCCSWRISLLGLSVIGSRLIVTCKVVRLCMEGSVFLPSSAGLD